MQADLSPVEGRRGLAEAAPVAAVNRDGFLEVTVEASYLTAWRSLWTAPAAPANHAQSSEEQADRGPGEVDEAATVREDLDNWRTIYLLPKLIHRC